MIKNNRFEYATAIVLAALVTVAAVYAAGQFLAVPATANCLRSWIASLPTDEACTMIAQRWGDVVNGDSARVMAAMAIVPPAVGLLVGVPIVSREIESGTAPLSWALAASRTHWLRRLVVPLGLLVVVMIAPSALAAARLAEVRSGWNVWSSTFADSDLFGILAICRALVAFAVGVLIGALVGRVLPAFLLAISITAAGVALVASLQAAVVHSTYEMTNVGGPGSAEEFLRNNPDVDVFFVLPGDKLVARDDAVSAAPPDVADPELWLADHARLVPLGVSESATQRWQIAASTFLTSMAVLVLGLAQAVVRRRPPR